MKIKKVIPLLETKWLSLKQAVYLDKKQKEQKWEYVERKGNREVVTVVCRAKGRNRLLFIQQPRVPFNKIVIGFPAGLIDKGETPEEAALRELKEETGYTGEIMSVGPKIAKSAGLSSETTYLVECWINPNAIGTTEMEDTEDIQSFWLTPLQFIKMAGDLDHDRFIIEMDAWVYCTAHVNSKKKPKKSKK